MIETRRLKTMLRCSRLSLELGPLGTAAGAAPPDSGGDGDGDGGAGAAVVPRSTFMLEWVVGW